MNKEPVGLYFFRILVSCLILFLAGMIYWSSALVEENVLGLKKEVNALKSTVGNLEEEVKSLIAKGINVSSNQSQEIITKSRPHIDEKYPNILQEDPFYEHTLPNLLGKDFKPYGILQTATVGKYDSTLPFSEWGEVATWTDWCSVAVANQKFGKYETFCPDMAIKMEERPSPHGGIEYWIHLKDGVFWEPLKQSFFEGNVHLAPHFLKKHQVTAEDFKFYYDAVMNPYISTAGAVSIRPYLENILEFRVIDPLTFVVRWKQKEFIEDGKKVFKQKYTSKMLTGALKPLASFLYKYYANGSKIIEDDVQVDTYKTNAIWAQGLAQHWARNIIPSCGPWIFDSRTEKQLNFKRNSNFYKPQAALVDTREVFLKESSDNIWLDFKGNKLTAIVLQPNQLIELDQFLKTDQYKKQRDEKNGIERLDYFARAFSYVGWNQKKVFFNQAKVRRALTIAVDRERINSQFLNNMSMQVTGPSYPFDLSYDQTIQPWPFDVQLAKKLLEEEGWYDHDGDGIIDKMIDGKLVPFRFTLNYLSRSSLSRNIAEFISTSLKEVGIDCVINGLDMIEVTAKITDRNFDAIMLSWSLGSPPEDHRQLWYNDQNDSRGSSNFIGFNNKQVNEIIDALEYENNSEKRIQLYHNFHRILHEEAPYLYLGCPKVSLIYREKLQNVFIPKDRQDLIPGADVAEPDSAAYWLIP